MYCRFMHAARLMPPTLYKLTPSCLTDLHKNAFLLACVLQVRYDAELAALRSGVERVVVELVVGPKSSAASRKAILPHMDDLAAFLGRRSMLTLQA